MKLVHITINRPGQMLIIALIFLATVMVLSASLFTRTAGFLRFGSKSISQEQTINLAEAGIERTLWKLNETAGACPDCTQEYTVGTTGTFKVTITNKTASLKTITSTGYVPNVTNPRAKQTIKVDALVSGESIAFRYAIQTKEGGVSMANSSKIIGTVYSNGDITGSGSSRIEGDAYAVGTISSPDPTVTGTKLPNASPAPAPTVNYDDWKNAAAAGGTTTCSPTCIINSNNNNFGPQKYVGSLEITSNAIATMKGPIWVAKDDFGSGGNFSMSQGGTTLKLDESFGSNGTVLIADGNVTLTQGGNIQPTTATPKGYIMVVTTSTSAEAVKISQGGMTAVFYALEGSGVLSQTAHVTTLVAKTLIMTQNSQLEYDQGLASASFTAGPGGSWQIKKGTYRFTNSP